MNRDATVQFSGNTWNWARVYLSDRYKSLTCGLCGFMDGWPHNDFTIVDTSPNAPGYFEILSSAGQTPFMPVGQALHNLWVFGDHWENNAIIAYDENTYGQW